MKYNELFAKRILQLCAERNYSVNKLATLCNLKQSTIENIINGASKKKKKKTLHKIANTFNMTLAEFLDFEELNNYSFDDEDNN